MGKRHASEIGPLVKIFLVLEGFATLLDVLMGVGSSMSTEESYNAAAAALIACGHGSSLWTLQYKWFCGGCSAEALMAAPLFAWFSPSILAWKWIMAVLHMVVVCAGAAIAGRAAGARPAFVFTGLMIAAPGFYRTLALTGFGNHAESTLFPFLAVAFMMFSQQKSSHWRIFMAVLAGVIMGLGIWFTPTALHGFVAVTAVAVWCGKRTILGYCAGLPMGMLPLIRYFEAIPHARVPAFDWWSGWSLAPLGRLVDWLVTDFVTGSLWVGVPPLVSALWWFLLVIFAVLGMGALFVRKERSWAMRWFVPLMLMGLLMAYAVRFDLWDDNPAIVGFDAFNLRYRAPLFPILALGAAMTSGAMDDASVFRKISAGAMVVLIATGFVLRAGGWQIDAEPVHSRMAVSIDGRVDWSVPEGEPPQRLARAMGRMSDIEAAKMFLTDHEDRLPVCRSLHHAELGRRIGLALMNPAIDDDLRLILEEIDGFEGESREALIRGIVASLELHEKPQLAWLKARNGVDRHASALSKEVSARLLYRGRSVGAVEP